MLSIQSYAVIADKVIKNPRVKYIILKIFFSLHNGRNHNSTFSTKIKKKSLLKLFSSFIKFDQTIDITFILQLSKTKSNISNNDDPRVSERNDF